MLTMPHRMVEKAKTCLVNLNANLMVIQVVKDVIRNSFLYDVLVYIRNLNEIRSWEKNGRPVPLPYALRQNILKEYAKAFSIDVLIETGTYLGDMVYATRHTFKRIFSIRN